MAIEPARGAVRVEKRAIEPASLEAYLRIVLHPNLVFGAVEREAKGVVDERRKRRKLLAKELVAGAVIALEDELLAVAELDWPAVALRGSAEDFLDDLHRAASWGKSLHRGSDVGCEEVAMRLRKSATDPSRNSFADRRCALREWRAGS